MKRRHFQLTEAAEEDIFEAWRLVFEKDGEERADALRNRIMAFVLGLAEFSGIGTRHEEFRPGFRSTGIPGLSSAAVFFVVSGDRVMVLGVSYLGRNVRSRFEDRGSCGVRFDREVSRGIAKADAGGPFVSHDGVVADSEACTKARKR